MAKKFKFKLDALLKLREFNEQKVKVELGQLIQEIQSVKDRISDLERQIDETYREQEGVLETPSSGQFARFFPYFIQAKKEDIKNNENILYALEKKKEAKLKEMQQRMGEVKVMENLKEKDKQSFKKESEKKMQSDIEEILMLKKHNQRGEL